MQRTQVYLEKENVAALKSLARREDKPMAQVIREVVNAGLSQKQRKTSSGAEFLLKMAKKASKKGPKDLSTRLDYYIYEEPYKDKDDS